MATLPYWFCTLFDRNYLTRGIALYRSLERHARDFRLFVVCMDDDTHETLTRLSLPKMTLVRLSEFEDPELLKAKATRSAIEYYWTCTPSVPLYVMERHPEAEIVTYIDSDMYFESDPQALYDEMGSDAVMIHEHRFPPRFAHFAENGIYNVGWVSFRNDARGLAVARRWREQCNEWCYYRLENGKLGDQKYLDTWTTDFEGVHVMQNKGGGTAPWNLEQYEVKQDAAGRILIDGKPLVFYHFHGLRELDNGTVVRAPSTYTLRPEDIRLIYEPYERALKDARAEVQRVVPGFDHGIDRANRPSAKDQLIQQHASGAPAAPALDPHAVVYTPAGPMRPGDRVRLPAVWRLTRDTWRSRDMISRLIRRDVQSRYRQFYLGSLWVVLQPVITVGVFLALSAFGVLNVGELPVPYPIFALAGMTIWQLFSAGVASGTGALASAGPLLIKVNVSKAALVAASLGTVVVDFAVRVGFLALMYAVFREHPPAAAWLALPALIPLILLTLAVALTQALLGVVIRDIAALVPTVLGLLVFLMPIYYATPRSAAFSKINAWNPLYHLVCGPRDLLLLGEMTNVRGFIASSILAVVLLFMSARLFIGGQYKIAERA
jgi:ABC-type polysaccharide/polyol phosphate export permease